MFVTDNITLNIQINVAAQIGQVGLGRRSFLGNLAQQLALPFCSAKAMTFLVMATLTCCCTCLRFFKSDIAAISM